jgi:hypothetical protein
LQILAQNPSGPAHPHPKRWNNAGLATDTRDQRSSSTHGSSSRVQSNVVSRIAKLSKMLVSIDILHSAKDSLGRRTAVQAYAGI